MLFSLFDNGVETNLGVMNRKTYNNNNWFYFTLDLKANETKLIIQRVLSNSFVQHIFMLILKQYENGTILPLLFKKQ